jgi:hypothetical protein
MHIQVYLYFEAASATSNSCGQCDVEFLKKRLGIEVDDA